MPDYQNSVDGMDICAAFRQEADELYAQLVEWRRDFHMYPELGFEETRTAGIVADHLHELGLEVSTGIGGTGVVALLEGRNVPADASTVLLRFDMDALPIQEENDLPYRSVHDGMMHACGHDGHTAVGMGVASVLTKYRELLPGRVMLLFQPAEEGLGGALAMVEDGVFDLYQPSASFGLHLWNRIPLNQVVVQAGPLWANAGRFRLSVTGRGGHGALPHETVDATLVASQIVVAWQSIVSRSVDPTETAVLSVGTFESGDLFNVISGKAELTGTIRSFEPAVETLLKERMGALAEGISRSFGASCHLDYELTIPATINSVAGAQLMHGVAEAIVGPEQIKQITPMMVGEDMSEFLIRAPGCFILVGAAFDNLSEHGPHHNPTFDFDERMLSTGVALLASAAVTYLAQTEPSMP